MAALSASSGSMDPLAPAAVTEDVTVKEAESVRAAASTERGSLLLGIELGLHEDAAQLVAEFERQVHPELRICFREDRADRLRLAIREAKVQALLTRKPLLHRERRQGLRSIVVRRHTLLPIVHRSNRVARLGFTRLAGLLTGQERDWSKLAANRAAVEIFGAAASSARQAFELPAFFPGQPLRVTRSFQSDAAIVQAVARHPAALALVPIEALDRQAAQLVRVLSLDGVAATPANLRAARWPLTWTLSLILRRGLPAGKQLRTTLAALERYLRDRARHDQSRRRQ